MEKHTSIAKTDKKQRIVYGEVYAPGIPDSDGDFMDAETIRKAAHKFMMNQRTGMVDTEHDNRVNGSYVVESFIARKGDPVFIEGSWVVGVHVPDDELWEKIEKNEINGFSMEATVQGVETMLELEIPETIEGMTTENEGHSHHFFVKYAEDGSFLGGTTDEVDGHRHTIVRGTVTEDSYGHRHNFSHVEGFLA